MYIINKHFLMSSCYLIINHINYLQVQNKISHQTKIKNVYVLLYIDTTVYYIIIYYIFNTSC